MLRAISLAILGTTLAAAPAAALSNAAQYLVAEQLKLGCNGQKGRFDSSAIQERELTGDGKLDLIIDHGGLSCSAGGNPAGRSAECGAAACTVLFYVRTGRLLKLSYEVASVGATIGSGEIPTIELIGYEFQKGFVRWNGTEFADFNPASTLGAEAGNTFEANKAIPDGRWTYSEHPVLGLSAHVSVGTEALGLACNYDGPDQSRSDVVAFRITPGFLPEPGDRSATVVLFEGDVGTTNLRDGTAKAGYLEVIGNSCASNVDSLQRAQAVLLVPGQIDSIKAVGDGYQRVIQQGETLHTIETDADLKRLSGVVRIPLDGSSKAIGQLIRFCMGLRLDIENNCGI